MPQKSKHQYFSFVKLVVGIICVLIIAAAIATEFSAKALLSESIAVGVATVVFRTMQGLSDRLDKYENGVI